MIGRSKFYHFENVFIYQTFFFICPVIEVSMFVSKVPTTVKHFQSFVFIQSIVFFKRKIMNSLLNRLKGTSVVLPTSNYFYKELYKYIFMLSIPVGLLSPLCRDDEFTKLCERLFYYLRIVKKF